MAPAQVLRPSRPGAAPLSALCLCLLAQPLVGCAGPDGAAQPEATTGASGQTGAAAGSAAAEPAISPDLLPTPAVFEATGTARWDGRRTLQGVWVTHPQASAARRVRIYNIATGAAADGALFTRDAVLSGPSILVSSDAARLLGMAPGQEAELRVTAVAPRAGGAEGALAAAPAAVSVPAVAPPADGPIAVAPSASRPVAASPSAAPRPAAPAGDAVPPAAARAAGAGIAAPGDLARAEAGSARPLRSAAPARAGTDSDVPARIRSVAPAERPALAPSGAGATPVASRGSRQETAGAGQEQAAGLAREPAGPPEDPAVTAAHQMPAGGDPQEGGKQPSGAPDDGADALAQPYVQAGLFTVSGNADRLIQRMQAAGLPALGKPVQLATGPATRVLAGPFATAAERDAARRQIRTMGLDDAMPVAR